MRIDGNFIPGREAGSIRPHEAGRRRDQPGETQNTTVAATGDLVALFASLNGAQEHLEAARIPLIEELRNAHGQGSIRIDSSRVATALLRFGYDRPVNNANDAGA